MGEASNPDPHASDFSGADDEAAARFQGLSAGERDRRRAAELRSEAAALDGGDLSDEDFHTLNGGGPAEGLKHAVWKHAGISESQIDLVHRQQRKSYKGYAPQNELEATRARCMILLETAATGAFQKAAAHDADAAARLAYMEVALRCLDGFNKISDRFERARGQAHQQIFVQHNRFDNGSQAVLQNVQAERVESNSDRALPGGMHSAISGTVVEELNHQPSPPVQRRRRTTRAAS